jgi:hypothetical protein
MKKKYRFLFARLLLGCFPILISCTHNPFSESTANFTKRQTVKGVVRLDDGSTPDDVFVWLEGLSVSTRTDESGGFELTLPDPQTQPGGGLSGTYKIYYYLGNYGISSSSTVLSEGYFAHGEGDIDDDGNIRETIVLQKLLNISTVVEPSEIVQFVHPDSSDIKITVTLDVLVGPLRVEAFVDETNTYFWGFFLKKLNTPLSEAFKSPSSSPPTTQQIPCHTVWEGGLYLSWYGLELELAEYEVVPYIHVVQEDLPDGLIVSIAEHGDEYHNDYLLIPFKQEPGYFAVRDSTLMEVGN